MVKSPLTVISAPAGYGKSSLVNYWLKECELPNTWLSLDESDNTINQFLRYFILAVQKKFPSFGGVILPILKVSNIPSTSQLTGILFSELSRIDQSFLLVLDDYHSIKEDSIHELLKELLRFPPPQMHLILISRTQPPLPLFTYRSHWQTTEISEIEEVYQVIGAIGYRFTMMDIASKVIAG